MRLNDQNLKVNTRRDCQVPSNSNYRGKDYLSACNGKCMYHRGNYMNLQTYKSSLHDFLPRFTTPIFEPLKILHFINLRGLNYWRCVHFSSPSSRFLSFNLEISFVQPTAIILKFYFEHLFQRTDVSKREKFLLPQN